MARLLELSLPNICMEALLHGPEASRKVRGFIPKHVGHGDRQSLRTRGGRGVGQVLLWKASELLCILHLANPDPDQFSGSHLLSRATTPTEVYELNTACFKDKSSHLLAFSQGSMSGAGF